MAFAPAVRPILPLRLSSSSTPPHSTLATRRALALWPRLDRRALLRCGGDPARLTKLVARRTSLPPAIIRAILDPGISEVDEEFWFG